jgi:hypothetical protein
VTWVFGVLAVSLGVFFLWGLIAPRSQWRVLSSWSVSNPYAHEPGGASYGWRRLLSGVGVLGLGVVAVLSTAPGVLASLPTEERVIPAAQQMWGLPSPQLVDRSVYGSTTAPEGLVEFPVLAYQDLDELDDLPAYLIELRRFSLLGESTPPGLIGVTPGEGFSGVGPANLVVNVRGSVLCIPREAVVIETETTVQIAVYYGRPDVEPDPEAAPDAAPPTQPDHVAGCPADDPITGSVLIPISLASALGDRAVQTMDGTEIRKVELPD